MDDIHLYVYLIVIALFAPIGIPGLIVWRVCGVLSNIQIIGKAVPSFAHKYVQDFIKETKVNNNLDEEDPINDCIVKGVSAYLWPVFVITSVLDCGRALGWRIKGAVRWTPLS